MSRGEKLPPRSLSLRLKEGLILNEADEGSGVQRTLVNEDFVRAFLNPERSFVGRRFQGLVENTTLAVMTEIVVVARNTQEND